MNASALDFMSNLGQKISYLSDDKEAQFLFQRNSVTTQRFNSVLSHDSFCIDCGPIAIPASFLPSRAIAWNGIAIVCLSVCPSVSL